MSNILIVTEYDNGGQMHALYKALNKYTEHKARLITFKNTYLDYDTDVFNPDKYGVRKLVKWADFYILGEWLPPCEVTAEVVRKINPGNCIVRAGGSLARKYPQYYMTGPFRDVMKAGCFHDPTLYMQLHPVAQTVNMYEFSEWPSLSARDVEPYRLVFSGTALKHTAEHSGAIQEAWEILGKKYGTETIEFVNIARKSWKESLKIKSTCHICYDQLLLGAYASSAIEGMYYAMPTFCYVSGWCYSAHPDVPLLSMRSSQEIVEKTVELIENPKEMFRLGLLGQMYAVSNHSSRNAVMRWKYLIDYIQNDYKIVK